MNEAYRLCARERLGSAATLAAAAVTTAVTSALTRASSSSGTVFARLKILPCVTCDHSVVKLFDTQVTRVRSRDGQTCSAASVSICSYGDDAAARAARASTLS